MIVADLETNAVHKPSRIWVVGILDYQTDQFTAYTGDDVPTGLMRLAEAELTIGHNYRGYDAKVVREMTNGLIDIGKNTILDTLDMSRAAFPKLENHKLATWGDIFGYPKIKYDKGFDRFHPEMVPYCEVDCRLTKRLYDFLLEQISAD